MRRLAAAGLEEFVAAPDPLHPACALAIDAWNFCDGWQPERLPLFAETRPVDDMAELVDLMGVIREHLQQQREPAA